MDRLLTGPLLLLVFGAALAGCGNAGSGGSSQSDPYAALRETTPTPEPTPAPEPTPWPDEIVVSQLRNALSGAHPPLLVDIREPHELEDGRIAGARHIPLGELAGRTGELPRDRRVILYCATGNRSEYGLKILREHDFDTAAHLAGGYREWVQTPEFQ